MRRWPRERARFPAASAPPAGARRGGGRPEDLERLEALAAEIDVIRALGAGFRMGVRWGVDFTLAQLRRHHDAVFLAVGAQRSRQLRCEGEEPALPALEVLEGVAMGNPQALGDDVVVAGGGNTAIDCARAGARRRFHQDLSHPEIVYEPGKCIVCDACVRIAAEA